jgi:hypothetical protein
MKYSDVKLDEEQHEAFKLNCLLFIPSINNCTHPNNPFGMFAVNTCKQCTCPNRERTATQEQENG